MTAIAYHEIDGEQIPTDVAESIVFMTVGGGVDTTTSLIGAALLHLCRFPDDRRRLVEEPDLLATATEEFLRFYPPARTHARTVAADVELAGCPMRKGDRVVLSEISAGHDEDSVPRRGALRDRPPSEPSPVVRHGDPPLSGLAPGAHRVHRAARGDLHPHARFRDRARRRHRVPELVDHRRLGTDAGGVHARPALVTPAESARGFWEAARADPDRVAVIDPAERAWTAGEMLSGANRLVHALRARGVQAGDPVATLTANSAELLQTLLAVFQAGWQYVPVNTHLTADEVAYILADSGAKAFVADERYADVASAAAETAGVPPAARLAVGAIPGFVPMADALAEQPDSTPGRPRRRWVHAVHVGHHRAAEGGAAGDGHARPRDAGRALRRQPHALRHRARR